jgi:hypothetical protein
MATVGPSGIVLVELEAAQWTRYHTPTLADLLTFLRTRLNDLDRGNYPDDEELYVFLNLEKVAVDLLGKAHKAQKAVTPIDGTHTYSGGEVFEPFEVRLGDGPLRQETVSDLGTLLEAWDRSPTGTPTKWVQLTGSSFRVHPTPDGAACKMIGAVEGAPTAPGLAYLVGDILTVDGGSGGTLTVESVDGSGGVIAVSLHTAGTGYGVAAGIGTTGGTGDGTCTIEITALATMQVHGYAISDALVLASEVPSSIPSGYALMALLDGAEGRARAARSNTNPVNAALAVDLRASSREWCVKIRDSTRGKG